MRACVVAFFTSYGELEQEVQIGEGEHRDMWLALKLAREGFAAASVLSLSVQSLITSLLVTFFHSSLDGGFARI